MKTLYLVLIALVTMGFTNAQNTDYALLWNQVATLEQDDTPRSALEVVTKIEAKAEAEANRPQLIKVLLYKSKYALILEEDAQLAIINNFKVQISKSEPPVKNVLQNMLAKLYWDYFQQNRYQFYDRTHTNSKVDETDFRTWDLETLFAEIATYFEQSLKHEQVLQNTTTANFNPILTIGKDTDSLRPTLYDFLAHNALEFFKTTENTITKPTNAFEISKASHLEAVGPYTQLHIASEDSSSIQLKSLQVYQNLLAFHAAKNNSIPLAAVDVERLSYVFANGRIPDKEALYITALESGKNTANVPYAKALYELEIAQYTFTQGQQYEAGAHDTLRWANKEALAIFEQLIVDFPNTYVAARARSLKEQITHPYLQLSLESYLPIDSNSRMLVTYKNVSSVQLSVYSISAKESETLRTIYDKDKQRHYIEQLKLEKEWTQQLRDEGDYRSHSTEILQPGFPKGRYLVLLSPTNNDNKRQFEYTEIQYTNIALVKMQDANDSYFQIVDRNSGQPLPQATCVVKNERSNAGSTSYTTDAKGIVRIPSTGDRYYNYSITVHNGNDTAHFDNFYTYHRYTKEATTAYNSFLFTDRSIYRPGQTVYFKGIVTRTEDKNAAVVPNLDVSVQLFDVNGEEVSTVALQTNEFGTVAGEFVLPHGVLTGQFRLRIVTTEPQSATETYLNVEEYKRPLFETKFKPVTETFRVNDRILVQGEAKSYAGSTISNAKVVYTVTRKVQYPRWYYWRGPQAYGERQEISFGETATNNKGEYDIAFIALPDGSVDKTGLPVFQYEISANVTDINGETQSTTTLINVGYHALTIGLHVPEKIDKQDKQVHLSLTTHNLNGEKVPAEVTVSIFKLKAPETVLRKRPWEAPDYQEYSNVQFRKLFPHDPYENEHNIQTWEQGEQVFTTLIHTDKTDAIALGNSKKWASGAYVIIAKTKDRFGQEVLAKQYTKLFSESETTPPDNELFSISFDQDTYKAGDNVIVTVQSNATLTVTLFVEKQQQLIATYIVPLHKNSKTLSVSITTEDVGGFAIHYSLTAFNSFEGGSQLIHVPAPRTELSIETKTFRDKLEPGLPETWSFTIKGPDGEKVSAELLASMYDASLDQFTPHQWEFNPQPSLHYRSLASPNASRSFGIKGLSLHYENRSYYQEHTRAFTQFNWFGLSLMDPNLMRYDDTLPRTKMAMGNAIQMEAEAVESLEEGVANDLNGTMAGVLENAANTKEQEETDFGSVSIRKNLQETAFFYPQLRTDAAGNISFNFTTPEALTRWKLQLLAHTKKLDTKVSTFETVTQKELMVVPNAPRFLREGDEIIISSKISNLSNSILSGQAILKLKDAITGEAIDAALGNSNAARDFSVEKDNNTQVSWRLTIPSSVQAVEYTVLAKTANFSDGEQNTLPVLSNRMLVTETLPMWVRSNETKTFTLDKLKNNNSTTLKHHTVTLEVTSNPAWYAVQALPYLMEFPYECNEQTFARYYANSLATHIANSNPRIKAVFDQWANSDALLSNLEKNEELKSVLIQETPWLRDAQSETEQKKRIALLFDLTFMQRKQGEAVRKLRQNQMPSGAWSWFQGGYANRYITQHIVSGFGHLKTLGVTSNEKETDTMIKEAISYLDAAFVKEYQQLSKYTQKPDYKKDHLSHMQTQYLYMRSFFPEIKMSKEVDDLRNYYLSQMETYWTSRDLYSKGMIALVLHRNGKPATAAKITKALRENSITSEELGMYWKSNTASWYWYQAPVETQALLIEVFSEIDEDSETIDNLKLWLLKQKQTNQWPTTKATTEAVYALLLEGSDWLSVTDAVEVTVGSTVLDPSKMDAVKVEAGTGYFKTRWDASEISESRATVTMQKKGEGIAWGGLYWQYFEDLDKITSAATPLQLKKKLFLKTNTTTGAQLQEITASTRVQVGDLVRVRIELRVDRDMDFIHMKDMRAAGLEPVDVLSSYKWQDGLGYYQATKDASTNFFFDTLRKGIYVFEYDVRVNNAGNFSNGITTIQSMYAPEFTSHSEGIRIRVE